MYKLKDIFSLTLLILLLFLYSASFCFALEGECIQGECANGKGMFLFENGDKFVGEFNNNTPKGEGAIFFASGIIIDGVFLTGITMGHGTIVHPDGTTYRGQFYNAKPNGKGDKKLANGSYFDGLWRNDVFFRGKGRFTEPNGKSYEGDYLGSVFHGNGILVNEDGVRYEGAFIDGIFHGHGKQTFPDGVQYVGSFEKGEYHGSGTLLMADGVSYEGQFYEGKFNGQGMMTWPDSQQYKGEFKNGSFEGHGVMVFADGREYKGAFKNNKLNGYGVMTNIEGDRLDGDFVDGIYVENADHKESLAEGKMENTMVFEEKKEPSKSPAKDIKEPSSKNKPLKVNALSSPVKSSFSEKMDTQSKTLKAVSTSEAILKQKIDASVSGLILTPEGGQESLSKPSRVESEPEKILRQKDFSASSKDTGLPAVQDLPSSTSAPAMPSVFR